MVFKISYHDSHLEMLSVGLSFHDMAFFFFSLETVSFQSPCGLIICNKTFNIQNPQAGPKVILSCSYHCLSSPFHHLENFKILLGALHTYFELLLLLLTHVRLFAAPWTAARQASLSFTIPWSLLKLMSIKLVMPSNHLVLCHPLLFLPSIFPSIRDFSKESALRIRWPKYWSFSFSVSPSNEHRGLISFRMDWFLLAAQRALKSLLQQMFWGISDCILKVKLIIFLSNLILLWHSFY